LFNFDLNMLKRICCKIVLLAIWLQGGLFANDKLAFATATDTEHYPWTLNLIASIHRFHEDNISIAVFDLGLSKDERSHLNELYGVSVYDVERVNSSIFQKFIVDKNGKIARGWYSWKPVVLKQSHDLFSEFFYVDSGITLQGPLHLLFRHLHENGYFLIDCGHSIQRMTKVSLIEKFQLSKSENQWILSQLGISAGFQGISSKVYESYVLPVYEMAYDIENFVDDGSCPRGFGWARHDQTLFSIQARLAGLEVNQVIRGGKLRLQIENQLVRANLGQFLKITRGDFDLTQSQRYLRYKTRSTADLHK
jgi:hypothetical protein